MSNGANVLVVGGGGREHALCWKLSQSKQVNRVYASPGNAGMAMQGVECVQLNVNKRDEVADWCHNHDVTLVVVGPEEPLANGITDDLTKLGLRVFGPRKAAAQIEASKQFAKSFMDRHSIPTARWGTFSNAAQAKKFIREAKFQAWVVKASGLAAGKGVVVATSDDGACQAVDDLMGSEALKAAAENVVIEELLQGEEVSVLCFTDGEKLCMMLPAQDHKRLGDGDEGPNTGGMGAYAPCPLLTDADIKYVRENILQRTVDGMRSEGCPFVGVLYAGLMVTKEGPKVLEFNCRMGDPETQVLLPLLESDLFEVMRRCVDRQVSGLELQWRGESAVGVVVASEGYPGSYPKGRVIKGLEQGSGDVNKALVFHAGTDLDQKMNVVTSGGRVLITVGVAPDLSQAASRALAGARKISFQGAHYRRDIAHKGIARQLLSLGSGGMTYRGAGVDIDAGERLVEMIGPMVQNTKTSGTVGSLGGFGAFFDLNAAGYKDPYLVSGTDGVGTKLKIAEETGKHGTMGVDLVAMCVNDILAHGAEPLFFLDYYACGKLDVGVASEVIRGVTDGCKMSGCALVGGETAELPGLYAPGCYDLAGFAVGAVDRGAQLPRLDSIGTGDQVIGVASSGVHSNGFSLVRRVVSGSGAKLEDPAPFDTSMTLGDALLTPTKIYVQSMLPLLRSGKVKALAHITGGGLTENIPRVLPNRRGVSLDAKCWEMPEVFGWIAGAGGVSQGEMVRTFNCGLGAVLIVDPIYTDDVMAHLKQNRETAWIVGHVHKVAEGETRVVIENLDQVMDRKMRPYLHLRPSGGPGSARRRRVAVLVSGSGTNLQSLIDHVNDPAKESRAEIVLVISNKEGVRALQRAESAGIPTKVISHKGLTRPQFDAKIDSALKESGVQFVCLAGFMRILTEGFVREWKGKLINVHPALLPAFPGTNAYQQAIDAQVRITGCTVHFVDEGVDTGKILVQEPLEIRIHDTVETLMERGLKLEHKVYPQALEMLVRDQVSLGPNGKLIWNL